jgi:hypothetical protein
MTNPHFKDAILDQLSQVANVAQFVSFAPDRSQRYARLHGLPPNHKFETLDAAVLSLIDLATEKSVNVRSFAPEDPKSREFIYGLTTRDDVVAALYRLSGQGLYTILNETIDVRDGGVSGVAFGNVIEFAPGNTPRCVEEPGTTALPRNLGLQLLKTVYQFEPSLDYTPAQRVEFSLHPLRRGFRYEHTIVWEMEHADPGGISFDLKWPNHFSRLLGDKAFGLLVADAFGLPVPRTTVIPRGLAPFTFGKLTGTNETWIRTCPKEQQPGFFTTQHGWVDPFQLLSREDPTDSAIASVLAQEGVEAAYSGALVAGADGRPLIDGVRGEGEAFMLGQAKTSLPDVVRNAVEQVYDQISCQLGPVRFEWVYDGQQVWVVQFHRGGTLSLGSTIYPGEPEYYHRFDVKQGLPALRTLIAKVQDTSDGILLVGDVGVTSHFGDVLRRAKIPSRISNE